MTQAIISNLNFLNNVADNYKNFEIDKNAMQNMSIPEMFQNIYNEKTKLINNDSTQTDNSKIQINNSTEINEINADKDAKTEKDINEQNTATNENVNDQTFNQNTSLNQTEQKTSENTSEVSSESIDIQFDTALESIDTTIENIDTEITEKAQKTDVQTQSEESDFLSDEEALKELNIESIDAETTSQNDDSSLLNRENIDEHVIKMTLNNDSQDFDVHLEEVKQPTQENNAQEATPSKIIEQVTKQLEGLKFSSKVDIVLNPENLGKINIQLIKNSAGLSAQFNVDSNETKAILQNQLDGLKDKLTSLGIGVDNLSVKVSDNQDTGKYQKEWTEQESSKQQNFNQQKQQKGNKNQDINFEEMIMLSQQGSNE